MSEVQVLHAEFPFWYPLFRQCTFESQIIELPEEFVDYLHRDGIVLPPSLEKKQHPGTVGSDDEGGWDEDVDTWVGSEFLELQESIANALRRFGDKAFIKLNWSSPRDAAYMTCDSSLCCTAVVDVFLLLKGSDWIAFDLDHAFEKCPGGTKTRPDKYYLVMREWKNMLQSMEFRCFVRQRELVAISQRDTNTFYDFLLQKRPELQELISDFFLRHIAGKFPDDDFVFDVYIDQRSRVWLVDINAYGEHSSTNPLLFSWEEPLLQSLPPSAGTNPSSVEADDVSEALEFRVVESQAGVRYGSEKLSQIPFDIAQMDIGELQKLQRIQAATMKGDDVDN